MPSGYMSPLCPVQQLAGGCLGTVWEPDLGYSCSQGSRGGKMEVGEMVSPNPSAMLML